MSALSPGVAWATTESPMTLRDWNRRAEPAPLYLGHHACRTDREVLAGHDSNYARVMQQRCDVEQLRVEGMPVLSRQCVAEQPGSVARARQRDALLAGRGLGLTRKLRIWSSRVQPEPAVASADSPGQRDVRGTRARSPAGPQPLLPGRARRRSLRPTRRSMAARGAERRSYLEILVGSPP